MCIVSIVRISNEKIILTHNRDELISRTFSDAFVSEEISGNTVFFPRDFQSNGTWISDGKEMTVCVINGSKTNHISQVNYAESRGKLPIFIHRFDSVEAFISETNFKDYEHVSMYVIEKKTQKIHLIIWDEIAIQHKILSENIIVNASSTLYEKAEKEKLWNDFHAKNPKTNDDIWNWHIQHQMKIHSIKTNIKTVCISQIEISNTISNRKFLKL